MDDEDVTDSVAWNRAMRYQCLQLATQRAGSCEEVALASKDYYDFVVTGTSQIIEAQETRTRTLN